MIDYWLHRVSNAAAFRLLVERGLRRRSVRLHLIPEPGKSIPPIGRLAGFILRVGRIEVLSQGWPDSSLSHVVAGRCCNDVTDAFVEKEIARFPGILKSFGILFQDSELARLAIKKYWAKHVEGILQGYLAAVDSIGSTSIPHHGYVASDRISAHVLRLALECGMIVLPAQVNRSLIPVAPGFGLPFEAVQNIFDLSAFVKHLTAELWDRFRSRPFSLRRPSRRTWKVAIENVWGVDGDALREPGGEPTFPQDLFFMDGTWIRPEHALVLGWRRTGGQERPDHEKAYGALGVKCVDTRELSAPIGYLLWNFIPRVIRAVAHCIVPLLAGQGRIVAELFVQTLRYLVGGELLLLHHKIEVFLDLQEHSFGHILMTALMNRSRGRTVWIPHSFWPTVGHVSGFLGYHTLIDHSDLHRSVLGRTWYSGMRHLTPVGVVQRNRCYNTEGLESIRQRTRQWALELKSRRRLVVVYPDSYVQSGNELLDPRISHRRYLHLMEALVEMARNHPEFHFGLKPKGLPTVPDLKNYTCLREGTFRPYVDRLLEKGRLTILHPQEGYWLDLPTLSRLADAVVAMPGTPNRAFSSAWVESISVNATTFLLEPDPLGLLWTEGYLGIHPDLVNLVHPSGESLGRALALAFDGRLPWTDRQGLHRLFDPHGDNHALFRFNSAIRKILGYPTTRVMARTTRNSVVIGDLESAAEAGSRTAALG